MLSRDDKGIRNDWNNCPNGPIWGLSSRYDKYRWWRNSRDL